MCAFVVACGQPPANRPPAPPSTDERGIRDLLDGEVVSGGLWFGDPACTAQFGHAGRIAPDAFDAFAHCVASLQLRATGREDMVGDTTILADQHGFEIEAHVVKSRLDYIGFSGRAPGLPDLPSITPAALESLRVAGDPNATISADDAARVLPPLPSGGAWVEHLRVCIADDGRVTTIMPGATGLAQSIGAFSAVARTWAFRPFIAGGKPLAVCAIIGLQYPTTPRERGVDRLPIPPRVSKAGHLVYNASPKELEALRLTGDKMIIPDAWDKMNLNGRTIRGSFKLCLDETGHYESGVLLQSTDVPGYDAKIARTMMTWTYRPYLLDGVATPVCGAITFIYSQR